MRKVGIIIVVALVLVAAATAGRAQAGIWPASCHSMKCVNRHLNNLNRRLTAVAHQVIGCEELIPITQYGDFELAGDGQADGAPTTGLDVTAEEDTVDVWFISDGCATTGGIPRPLPRGTHLTPRRVGD
jgi:hypothetical protein